MAFGDIHFHHTHRFSHITDSGFTIRELEHLSCADTLIRLYQEEHIDKLVCLGDIWGPIGDTMSAQTLKAILDFFNKFNEAKNRAIEIFGNIKQGIEDKINGAKDAVSRGIERIKSLFNFSWSLPKLKLPHFSVSGKFSLNPPSVPKFSVSWYQKGGVFDNPTLFSYGNGMLGGLGENGAEAVVPLEKNTEWMNVLAGRLSELMSGGNTPIVLQVDGKTFAEASIDTINQLTRQKGYLALNLV
jgi:hypothetical protein